MNPRLLLVLSLFATTLHPLADGPKDNIAENVRRIPPPGVAISESDRTELQARVDELGRAIESAHDELKNKPSLSRLLPDVQIFHNAVRYALKYDEFFNPTNEVAAARELLNQGFQRLTSLKAGHAPWTTSTGLVVRGYVSKIDGSVQPYGLVVPASYQPPTPHQFRLDTWFHGRDEKLTELSFLTGRQKSAGEFVPANTFVLHLYGRYCNANKFAGEIDLLEALDDVQARYPIDSNRIVVRGFSMGGAACWQFAAHYADRWAAAAPGAGFAETADFLKVFQSENLKPSWYEQKLWHWYDCTDYALNLFHCPVVAYSGEIDKQIQAATVMSNALAGEGLRLMHVIGPQTGHKYHPDAKAEINRRIDQIAAVGRNPLPKSVRFTTWTLRYPKMFWVNVEGLEQHWEQARVEADILDARTVEVKTKNVSHLTLDMAPGLCPLDNTRIPTVKLDGQELTATPVLSDRSWVARFQKEGAKWSLAKDADDLSLRKRPGLQGPIDDAFLGSFIMVSPSGKPLNSVVGAWTAAEEQHALEHWRRQFRGEARVKKDSEITDDDLASNNLVLWGDPASNALLARIAPQLPIRWDAQGVHTGDAIYPADRYAPVMIYPNPLNPKRYIVINSGFTFREYDYLNNARQVSKLPDYAIMDLSIPATSRAPAGVSTAGFFNEKWELSRK